MKQEPRHLQLLADLEDSSVFSVITGRKLHNAPTDFQFCIKVAAGEAEIIRYTRVCVCVCHRGHRS